MIMMVKKMNKSPCSSRCGLSSGPAAARGLTVTSPRAIAYIEGIVAYYDFSAARDYILAAVPSARVRPRRHATQRARRSEIFTDCRGLDS